MTTKDRPEGYGGTRAARPDLDWSQVRETVLILELVAGQIMAAMRDSDTSVDVLANTFTSMAGYLRNMAEIARDLPATAENAGPKTALVGMADQVGGMINQAVVSFQFYDKLIQRLSHVVNGLADISDLVGDQGRLYNPGEWLALQERYQAKFSTPEERALFEAVLIRGLPVSEALENYVVALREKDDDIELF
jgi:hypothetical protein